MSPGLRRRNTLEYPGQDTGGSVRPVPGAGGPGVGAYRMPGPGCTVTVIRT